MNKRTGGCLCGGVRYECGEPVLTGVCHCTHCQKTTGSAFSILIGVPADTVRVTNDATLAVYEDLGSSGKPVLRKFCRNCGAPVISDAKAFPDILFVKVGTLDDTSSIKPTMHIWTDSAQPWVSIDETASKFPGNP
jgi:hypothetical protein